MCFDHHRLHVALAAPLAGSTTLCQSLSPSPPSPPCYRHRPAHHWCSPRSFVRTQERCHVLSSMRFNHHCLHVAFGPGLPHFTGPAAPRRLHRPPVAVAPLTTGVHQGVSPRVFAKVASPTLPRSLNTRALNVARLLQPGHRALSGLLKLPGHWDWAFTAAPLPPPGSWHWDLTATRPSAPQRLLLSSAPPYHRTSSNPEGKVQRLSTMRSDPSVIISTSP